MKFRAVSANVRFAKKESRVDSSCHSPNPRRWFVCCVFLIPMLVAASSLQADWKTEWESALEAARKEKALHIYVNRGPKWEDVLAQFNKEYPEIKLTWVRANSIANATRVLAERRAGKYIGDVFLGSPTTVRNHLYPVKALDPIKPLLLLPEVVDPSKWFQSKLHFSDREGVHIFVYLGSTGSVRSSYNTKLVNPKEFTSYRDFVRPRWKGKIASIDPRLSGAPARFFFYNSKLGPEFVRELYGAMDITYSRDFRQLVDWLANGRFSLCLGCRDVPIAKTQGLPVDEFDKRGWKEGTPLSAGGGAVSFLTRAPHPNAAKVFVNWFLSRNGQTAYQALGNPEDPDNSRRTDISKDIIPEQSRISEDREYTDLDLPEIDPTPVNKIINEILTKK
jgi:iron(III) transport system substrate-binding protein